MTQLVLLPELLADIDRIVEHLLQHDVADTDERIDEIPSGLDLLLKHPAIGRPVADGRRELVLGRGVRGYVARYRYEMAVDTVFVLALRAQREAGFAR